MAKLPTSAGNAGPASRAFVSRLVEMSFGERFKEQAARLVSTYFEYREGGYLKQ